MRIDLESGNISTEKVKDKIAENFIGGMGVAAAIFSQEVSPDIDPYDGQNLLIFSVGPFCGTSVPFCGRHFVMAKSPLTNLIGEASSGGFWGKELKYTGFDHIIIKGKSVKPVFLWINDGNAEIKDASELWGKGNSETLRNLKKKLNDVQIKVASIGPAGENLVKYSSIINDEHRAAARCGLGAIMGSKKLKAIAVRGKIKPTINDEIGLKKIVDKIKNLIDESPNAYVHKEFGTSVGIDAMTHIGDVPMKNYTMSRWSGSSKIGADALMARGVKHSACFNCPVGCTVNIKNEDRWVRGPEYETLAMLGTNLLVDDLEAIIKWNLYADDMGIDTISLGATISMFLEAAERNVLNINFKELGFQSENETERIDFHKVWGSVSGVESLIIRIVNRKGIGNDLAEGVKNFCEKYQLPRDMVTHGKGLEVPAHEPRANNLTALDFATSSRGAYHCYEPAALSSNMNLKKELGLTKRINRFSTGKEVADAVKKIQDSSEAYSACGGCIFGFHWILEIAPWVEALNAIIGNKYTVKKWVEAGERIFNTKRIYNLRCGMTKESDMIGDRFLFPIEKGGTRKNIPPLNDLVPLYYKLRRWDLNGHPPKSIFNNI